MNNDGTSHAPSAMLHGKRRALYYGYVLNNWRSPLGVLARRGATIHDARPGARSGTEGVWDERGNVRDGVRIRRQWGGEMSDPARPGTHGPVHIGFDTMGGNGEGRLVEQWA